MLGRNMLSMSGLSLYRNAVQFGLNIFVAAHVAPSAYGLVVFTTPFLVLSAMMTDLGLSSAIIRAPKLPVRDAEAALGAMLLGGICTAAIIAAIAWPLQRGLAMPGLAPVMATLAVSMFLGVAAATPRALMERELRYHSIAAIEAGAIALAIGVAIVMVSFGAGVWGLVAYNLVTQVARVIAFASQSRPILRPRLAWSRIAPLISFGGWVLSTNLLNFVARNSDNLLIGAWLGATAVGEYGLAYQFMLAPLMAITWPTSAILLSTLRGRDAGSAEAQALVQGVISATALVVVPAMFYLTFGLAWPVAALLSHRWALVPGLVAWLAPAGALQAIASYNGALLLAAGRARAQFWLTVLNSIALLATFIVTLPYGLLTLVKAYVVVISLLSLAFLTLIIALTGLTWGRLGQALAPGLLATGLAMAAVIAIDPAPASWGGWLGITALYGAVVLAVYAAAGSHVRRTLATLAGRPAPIET